MIAMNQAPVDYQKMYDAAPAATLNSMSVVDMIQYAIIPRNAPVDYPMPASGITPFMHYSNLGMINANLPDVIKIEAAVCVCPHIMQRKIVKFVMDMTAGSVNPNMIMPVYKAVKDTEAALDEAEPKPEAEEETP